MAKASDYFGGPAAVAEAFRTAIYEGRVHDGIFPEELEEIALVETPGLVAGLEDGTLPASAISAADILTMTAQLSGLTVERILVAKQPLPAGEELTLRMEALQEVFEGHGVTFAPA